MSLAHMLLNNTSVMEAEEKIDEEIEKQAEEIKAHVSDDATTEAWTDFAVESLVNDIYTIDKAYHTADIIAEVKVLREGADPAILLEGIVKSGITKIKEAFKNFWAKIKSWFAEAKRQLMIMSKSGKDFIKQFKSEIEKKYSDTKGKNFSYVGREYDIDAGDKAGESIFKAVQVSVEKFVGYVREGDKAISSAEKKEVYALILERVLACPSHTQGNFQDSCVFQNHDTSVWTLFDMIAVGGCAIEECSYVISCNS